MAVFQGDGDGGVHPFKVPIWRRSGYSQWLTGRHSGMGVACPSAGATIVQMGPLGEGGGWLVKHGTIVKLPGMSYRNNPENI